MNRTTHISPLTSIATLIALLVTTTAQAQTVTPAKTIDDAWRFQVSPYVWMTGLEGDIKPLRSGPTAHVNKSFSDVLGNLDVAAFVMGSARKGDFVILGDYTYASSSQSASLPLGLSANAKVRQTSLTLLGGYNWQATPQSSIDWLAGGRYWDIKATVDVPNVAGVESNTSFVDPVIGVRWRYDIAPRWSTLAYVDAGGFGIGSEDTWQVMGAVNYEVRDNIHVSVGYRYMHVNYRDDGKRLDFRQQGPMVGATFRF